MDANEAKRITTSALERMSKEESEALEEQQRLEQARLDEIAAKVVTTRALVDEMIIGTAQGGGARCIYPYTVRIPASRYTTEEIKEIKAQASEVVTGIIKSLAAEGFSQNRLESREERDIRDNVNAAPEYYIIPIMVSWPGSTT